MILFFILIGLLSGLFSGLLGIGGGVITVPFLYFIFKIMQVAVGTSLAASFITAGISAFFQYRKGAILFSALKWMVPALVLGGILGTLLAHFMPSRELSLVFGIVAICLGLYFFFPKLPELYISASANRSLSLFALFIGTLSTMLGIGGGSISFPILLGYRLPVQQASGTSSASTFVTTFIGSLAYLAIAGQTSELPDTFGYIQLPAFLAITLGSAITSPIGVKLSHTLPVSLIKRIFGACLFLVGLSMIFL